jgi:DNA-binding response OmpR family regulator
MVARVRSLLRRVQSGAAGDDRVVEGSLVIDSKEHSVEVESVPVSLTPTEFDMLLALAAHPGRVFTRRQLIESAQGDFFEGYERTVDAHIGNIRKKINENAAEKNLIETVYGVGYRYKA